MIQKFNEFNEAKKAWSDTAGIAIVLDTGSEKMILLVHPTGSSWKDSRMGIPKGKIEDGENILEAALRETFEETGIKLATDMLDPTIETAEVWKGTKFMYSIHYLVCRISDPSEIGLSGIRVPKDQLQKEEVDWAGFLSLDEAYGKVANSQRIILDRLR
jgi:predicted NUDIX family NTP pyrophosphohydrolase